MDDTAFAAVPAPRSEDVDPLKELRAAPKAGVITPG